MNTGRANGFTIVELLIVIVVIAIIAAITIVAYSGIQSRAQQAKINADLTQLEKAIMSARINNGEQVLQTVTNNWSTAGACISMANGTDLSNKTVAASCWSDYTAALNAISTVSGINVRGLVDPWGRPYFLDENEREGGAPCGGTDNLATYARPHVMNGWGDINNYRAIAYVTPGC